MLQLHQLQFPLQGFEKSEGSAVLFIKKVERVQRSDGRRRRRQLGVWLWLRSTGGWDVCIMRSGGVSFSQRRKGGSLEFQLCQ